MINGKEFGAAIGAAIKKKQAANPGLRQKDIAVHFGVKPPSLSDWIKKGSICKSRLSDLWRYFSDVAGPSHWGMTPDEWPSGLVNIDAKTTTSGVNEPTQFDAYRESAEIAQLLVIKKHPAIAEVADLMMRVDDVGKGMMLQQARQVFKERNNKKQI